MIKTISELQSFILWAKDAKIKSFKVGQIEVELSDLAFIDAIEAMTETTPSPRKTEEKDTSKVLVDTMPEDADEDDLFWSSKA